MKKIITCAAVFAALCSSANAGFMDDMDFSNLKSGDKRYAPLVEIDSDMDDNLNIVNKIIITGQSDDAIEVYNVELNRGKCQLDFDGVFPLGFGESEQFDYRCKRPIELSISSDHGDFVYDLRDEILF